MVPCLVQFNNTNIKWKHVLIQKKIKNKQMSKQQKLTLLSIN